VSVVGVGVKVLMPIHCLEILPDPPYLLDSFVIIASNNDFEGLFRYVQPLAWAIWGY
jgi:hypothetical protein